MGFPLYAIPFFGTILLFMFAYTCRAQTFALIWINKKDFTTNPKTFENPKRAAKPYEVNRSFRLLENFFVFSSFFSKNLLTFRKHSDIMY